MSVRACLVSATVAAAVLAGATAAAAAPLEISYTTDQQAGALGATPFGPNSVVVLRATYDDASPLASTVIGSAGTCFSASASSVQIDGGPIVAITDPIWVCATTTGFYPGLYVDQGATLLAHSDDAHPGLDLATPSGPHVISANQAHVIGLPVATTAGALSLTSSFTNTGASNFSVTAAASPAVVPTLSEWALILFGGLLAMTAGLTLARRRRLA